MEISPLTENGSWWQCRTRLERRLSLCATVAVLVACGIAIVMAAMIYQNKDAQKVPDMASAAALTEINNCELHDSICNTPGCVIAAADLLDNMNEKIDPCEDFYSFACGGFESKAVIPENKKSVDVKTLIREQVDQQMRFLMEKPIKEYEVESSKLVKKLYQSCVNPRVEELGMEPLKEILEQLGGWPVVEEEKWNETNFVWYETFYKLRQIGYYSSHLIELTHKTDKNNSNSRILELDQGLMVRYPGEDLTEGLENVNVKARLEYEIGLAKLLGADEEGARLQQTQALEFEILFTNIHLPYREHRKAKERDNRMTIKELSAKIPGIPWLEFINTMLAPYHVLTEDEIVNVPVPDYFSKLVDLLAKTPKRTVANYFMSKVSFELAGYLNEAARKLRLKYLAAVYGTKENNKPRWVECMDVVKHSLRLAMNAMYVREFFDEDTRQSVEEMIKDIQNVFIEMFDEADWIDNKTKEYIKKKATSTTAAAIIAYPDELLRDEMLLENYENLTLGSNDFQKNSLNLRNSSVNNYFKNLLANKEEVPTRDISLNPFDVAVYNFINGNSIQIPAAILQGAFFGKDRPTYLNYAAIGQLIGHMITHSFQEQGQKYDHEGNRGECNTEFSALAHTGDTQHGRR